MNTLIVQLEKAKPFFEKVSRNTYLRAIQNGFIAAMPAILFSSLFLLVANVPEIFGYKFDPGIRSLIVKPYIYTMGIVALMVAGTTAKALSDSFNRDLPKNNQINSVSTMLASISGFLLLAADAIEGGFGSEFLGTKGLLTAFLSAFVTGIVYRYCVKHNLTIRMPEEVPPNISKAFRDIIPFGLSVLAIYVIDLLVRQFAGVNAASAILKTFEPLFSAADGYVGITLIYGAYALFWFVGIHGPSIVDPAIAAITYANVDANFQLFQAGQHADKIISSGAQTFIVTMGGTGATLVVPFMFMWLTKSKRNRAVGRASVVPTFFGVNEPILFGAPIVLNPIFFVPFILAPIVNIWIFKFFVEVLGMNSFIYTLSWTTPAPIGTVMGTGFAPLSFVLAALLIVVDVIIYYPFLKVYDEEILAEEEASHGASGKNELQEKVAANFNTKKAEEILANAGVGKDSVTGKHVLVLCAGGGTSGLLANALNKAAKEHDVPITAAEGAYGSHTDILKDFDLVILAPQVASNYEDIKQDTDRLGIKLVKTEGAQYIQLTRDGRGSLDFVLQQFEE